MSIWTRIKSFVFSWWQKPDFEKRAESWSIHNEYLMKTFFPKFRNSGKTESILEDFEKVLTKIDETECVYIKSAQIKNLRKAVEILNEK